MSQLIEFYVPATFQWKPGRTGKRGQLIAFPKPVYLQSRRHQDESLSNIGWVRTNIRSVFRSR
jgi:hypothetical protein